MQEGGRLGYNRKMSLVVCSRKVKSVLSSTGIPGYDYCLNPYTGCSHACRYCYATFMARYSGHSEPWGSFADVKSNAPEVLERQLARAEKGSVFLSSVTDPYQAIEADYGITRRCLALLLSRRFPVGILTKSPLVLRDLDLIGRGEEIEVGITLTTDDDGIRELFEPGAPPVRERLDALKKLFRSGVSTYAFIGPVLPMNPEALLKSIRPYVRRVFIDRMNYVAKTKALYRREGLEQWLNGDLLEETLQSLREGLPPEQVTLLAGTW